MSYDVQQAGREGARREARQALWAGRASSGRATPQRAADVAPARLLYALGSGTPLSEALKRALAPRLQAAGIPVDLDAIRLHTDAWADALCSELSARALTVGAHLAFRAGTFQPASPAGLSLLVHELTHVWQQAAGQVGQGLVSESGLERQADAVAVEVQRPIARGPLPTGQPAAAQGPTPEGAASPAQPTVAPTSANAVQLFHEGSGDRFHPYLVAGGSPLAQGRDAVSAARAIEQQTGESLRDLRVVGRDQLTILGANGTLLARVRLTGRPPALPPGIYTAARDTEGGRVVGLRWGARVDRGGGLGHEVHRAGAGLRDEFDWADLASAHGLGGTGFTVWVYPGEGGESPEGRLPGASQRGEAGASRDHEGADRAAPAGPQGPGQRAPADDGRAVRPGGTSQAAAGPGAAPQGPQRAVAASGRRATERGQHTEGASRQGADSGTEAGGGALDAPLPSHLEGPERARGGHDAEFRDIVEVPGGANGGETLSQVDAYDRYGSYRWELFDLTEEARLPDGADTRRDALAAGAGHGARISDRGALASEAERTQSALGEDARSAVAGVQRGRLITRLANVLNVLTTPVDGLIEGARGVGHLAAVVIAGSSNRRFVAFPARDGVFAVRCTAVPRDRDGRQLRAPSIAVRMVEVTTQATAVNRALQETAAAERDQRGSVADSLRAERAAALERIRTLERQPASAQRDRELEALRAQSQELERSVGIASAHSRDFGSARQFRPHAVYVDDERGQTLPLRLVVGAPTGADGTRHSHFVDLTIPESAEALDGDGATGEAAVWAAIEAFAREGRYGRGTLGIRLPAELREHGVTTFERRIRTFPQDGARAEATLSRALELAGYATMLMTGPAALAAGAAVAAAGAVMSAHRLASRHQNHTLRAADPETVADLANILVGVASGASAVGRLAVRRTAGGFELFERATVSRTARVAATTEAAANQVALISGEASALDAIRRIEAQEAAGLITHAQAEQQRRDAVFHLVQQGAMHVHTVQGHLDAAREGGAAGAQHAAEEHGTPSHPDAIPYERAEGLARDSDDAHVTHAFDQATYAAMYRDAGGSGPVPPHGFETPDGRRVIYTPGGSLQPREARDAGVTPGPVQRRNTSEAPGPRTAGGGRDTHPDAAPWGSTAGRDTHPDAAPWGSTAGRDTHPDAAPWGSTAGRDTHPDAAPWGATHGHESSAPGERRTPTPGEGDWGGSRHATGRETPAPDDSFGDGAAPSRDTWNGARRSRHPEGPVVDLARAPGERDTVNALLTDAPGGPQRRSPDEARRAAPAPLRAALAAGDVAEGTRFRTRDREEALGMYRTLAEVSPNREVAIFRNVRTGDYFVVQGGATSVDLDTAAMSRDLGIPHHPYDWLTRRHVHPLDSAGRTGPERRVPSGLDADLGLAVNDAATTGRPMTEVIDFPTSRGFGRVEYGFDPTDASPYFFRRYEPGDGGALHRVAERRFRSAQAYHEYLSTLGASSEIPDGYEGRIPDAWSRRVDPASAQAAQGGPAQRRPGIAEGEPGAERPSAVPERAGGQGTSLRPPGEASASPRTGLHPDEPQAVRDVVGADGVVPTGQHLRFRAEGDALSSFRALAERSPEREVLLVQDVVTGDYYVVQGGPAASTAREAELAAQTGRPFDRAEWRAIRHTHPAHDGETPGRNHGPSPGDIRQLVRESAATGRPARSQIDFRTGEGWGHTEYGFDPQAANPYWVRVRRPDGTTLSDQFSEFVGFSRWARRNLNTEGDNANFNPTDLQGRPPQLWRDLADQRATSRRGPAAPRPQGPSAAQGQNPNAAPGQQGPGPTARQVAGAQRRDQRAADAADERARIRAYGEALRSRLNGEIAENRAENASIDDRLRVVTAQLVALARERGLEPGQSAYDYLAHRHPDASVRERAQALLTERDGDGAEGVVDGLRERAERNRAQNGSLQETVRRTPMPDDAAAVYDDLRRLAGQRPEAAAVRRALVDVFGRAATAADIMTTEHIHPLVEIVYTPGFTSIRSVNRQLEIINDAANLVPLLRSVNSQRSDRAWADASQWMTLPRNPGERAAALDVARDLAQRQAAFSAQLARRIEAALAAER